MDFRKKKQKKLKPESDEAITAGDFWGFTVVKRKSLFFAAFELGKRTTNTCRGMFNKFEEHIQKPTKENKLVIYSDGNFEYQTVLQEYFGEKVIDYGQIIKVKKEGKVVDKKKKVIFGSLKIEEIETTTVECMNSILRERLSRLVRKTKCHAKSRYRLEDAVELFRLYWNFMKKIRNGRTPGMLEGLTHKIWTWGNFLHVKKRDVN